MNENSFFVFERGLHVSSNVQATEYAYTLTPALSLKGEGVLKGTNRPGDYS
jgi:hypothetical protein